jgi:thioredoxin-like negative regulator of GroEL
MSVIVKKFGAAWCGPCRALGPVLEGIKNDFAGKATFIEYDVDNSPEEAQKYSVTSIPLVVIEKDGVVVERFQGLSSKVAYVNAINEAIG